MTTITDSNTRAALEQQYVEALADESPGALGRAAQIASDPLMRDHVTSVTRDHEAIEHVRIALRKDHVSMKRLTELHKLRDKAEKNLRQTEAALAEAQHVADAAKREHEQLHGQVYQCERQIESIQYQATTHPLAFRAVAAEVKAAGIDT